MKLSDVVSGAGLAFYAEVALVIFFVVFMAVMLRILFSRKSSMDEAAMIPLRDLPSEQRSDKEVDGYVSK